MGKRGQQDRRYRRGSSKQRVRNVFVPVLILLAFCILAGIALYPHLSPFIHRPGDAGNAAILYAYHHHLSDVYVTGSGKVVKTLRDDTSGIQHQRFIVRLPSGLTVLIVHNIDVAPRVPGLKPGDGIEFSGVYEWNAMGGVIHWTHHDPVAHHRGGWLKHNGRLYE